MDDPSGKMTQNERRRMRKLIRARDGDACHWCPDPMIFPDGASPGLHSNPDMATIDHVIERRHGGTNDPVNLVLAHYRCNSGRDNAKLRVERAAARVIVLQVTPLPGFRELTDEEFEELYGDDHSGHSVAVPDGYGACRVCGKGVVDDQEAERQRAHRREIEA